jgi:Protein of unknown function (DUF429)
LSTVTLGIDLASQTKGTAICAIEWGAGSAVLRALSVGVHDGTPLHDKFLITTIAGMRQIGQGESPIVKVGIDAPFGWPDAFVAALNAHHSGDGWPSGMDNPRSPFYWRATDKFVMANWKKTPLSVSTDKIAVVAMRCAVLLEDLQHKLGPGAVDRTGSGVVCEVYPDPALRYWTAHQKLSLVPREPYKGSGRRERRQDLLTIIREQLALEDPLELLPLGVEHDDALDALICACIARAAWLDLTVLPPDPAVAEREGWIHLPEAPLEALLRNS